MAQAPEKLIVVTVDNDDKSLQIGLCPDDYSKIYTLGLYKQEYDAKTKEWSSKKEVTERFESQLKTIGGIPNVGDTIDVYTSENGKAYLEPSTFIQTEKPTGKMIGKLLTGCKIEQISDSAKGRRVIVQHKGHYYEFSFNTSVWVPTIEKFVPNDAKLAKARERFDDIFEESTINWANALADDGEGNQFCKGIVMNCIVRKNELDTSGNSAFLEPLKIEEPDDDDKPF